MLNLTFLHSKVKFNVSAQRGARLVRDIGAKAIHGHPLASFFASSQSSSLVTTWPSGQLRSPEFIFQYMENGGTGGNGGGAGDGGDTGEGSLIQRRCLDSETTFDTAPPIAI